MSPCQGNFCSLGAVSASIQIGRGGDEIRMIIVQSLSIVRPGLKDFLMKMTPEAQVELRTFVLKTVVQKVSEVWIR